MINTEEYKTRIPKNIIPLEEYEGSFKKILHKCLTCDNIWSTKPAYLMKSKPSNCPVCSRKSAAQKTSLTHSEFISTISNKEISFLTEYKNNSTKILVQHSCGYKWEVLPSNLRDIKSGCPSCNNKIQLTHEDFVSKMKIISPDIKIIGTYIKQSQGTIEVQHSCSYKWNPLITNLIKGSGCPNCSSSIYGTKTIYNGILYDSKFEAKCAEILYSFVDSKYVTEQQRYPNSKRTVDFYIPLLDIYIEVSLFNDEKYMNKINEKRSSVKNFYFVRSLEQMEVLSKEFKELLFRSINYGTTF